MAMLKPAREMCELALQEGLELIEQQERTKHIVLKFQNKAGEVMTQILGRNPSRGLNRQDVVRTQFKRFARGVR